MTKDKEYSYNSVVSLIPLIELLFENKLELEHAYFRSDLPFIIKKLDEVFTHNESIDLIRDIDKLAIYELYKSWFDKKDFLDLSIRIRLYDFYKKNKWL